MGSCRGGMDIEAVARDEPNAIICLALPTEPEGYMPNESTL